MYDDPGFVEVARRKPARPVVRKTLRTRRGVVSARRGHSQLQWPELPLAAWSDTYQTLHLWLQIVGKVRLAASPWVNHSWHVTLYVTRED